MTSDSRGPAREPAWSDDRNFRNACGSSLDGCSTQSPCDYVFLSYSCNGTLPCRTRNFSYPQVTLLILYP